MDLRQYHLYGKGFSGRGVRLRELDGRDAMLAERCAAAKVGKDSTVIEYRQHTALEFACRMLAEVTDACEPDALLTASWRRVTQQQLEDEEHRMFYELFGPKDIAWFTSRYQREYEISMSDVDAIEGKALTVTGA